METSEILVHVSAPSTAADDARYHAQVQAILGFHPASCQVITFRSGESPGGQVQEQNSHDQGRDCPHADGACHHDTGAHAAGPSLPCTSKSSDLDLHVIPSPYNHNVVPSTVFAAAKDSPASGGAQDSLGSPVSVIPDSQPERLAPDNATDFETSGRYKRVSSPNPSSPPLKRCRTDLDPTPYQPSKDLPREQSPAAEHEGKEEQEQEPKGKHLSQQIDYAPRPPSDSTPPPIPKSKSKLKSLNKDKDKKASLPSVPVLDIKIIPPMQIRPPPPPISNNKFTTHITPTLSMLFNRLHSPRIYTPAHQSRSLDILERGYWYLRIDILHADADADSTKIQPDPNTWDSSLFQRFWSFLSAFVGKEGRAGWGVWCILEDVSSDLSTDSGSGSGSETRSSTQSSSNSSPQVPFPAYQLSLKVYAWGEIAVHVYLLLFLASERRIRKMSGARWHDGSDEIVIRMPESTASTSASTK